MKYLTKIGEVEVSDEDTLFFPFGIPGFDRLKKYALFSLPDSQPIQWLVSLEDQKVAFPLIDPWTVRKDYAFDLPQIAVEILGIQDKMQIMVLCILRIPQTDPKDMTVNLVAPIIINLQNHMGVQVVLEKTSYQIRHFVLEEISNQLNGQAEGGSDAGIES